MSVLHLVGRVYDSALSLSITSANIGNIFSLRKLFIKIVNAIFFVRFNPFHYRLIITFFLR